MASHVKGLLYGTFGTLYWFPILHELIEFWPHLVVTACLTSLLATNATPSEPGRIINIPSVISDNTEGTNQEQLSLDCRFIRIITIRTSRRPKMTQASQP